MLAHVLATRHQDMWLSDLLQTTPSADFSFGLRSLAHAAEASAIGDPDLALIEARRAKEVFRKAASAPGDLRAAFEEIYALHRQYHLQSCIDKIGGIEPVLQRVHYPWITAQINLERYACASTDPNSTEYTLARARKSAQQAGYGTLYLRALGFCASNQTGSGSTDRAWEWDRVGLEQFWSGQYPSARAQHFYDDLSISAEDSAKWLLAVVLEREAVSAIAASPNRTSEGIERIEPARSAANAHFWREAEDQYSKALDAFAVLRQDSSTRALHASAEIRLGEVALSQGHIRDAEPHIRYARENLPPDFDESQTWAALYTQVAEIRRLTDDPAGFRRACQAAVLVAEADLKEVHSELERLRWKQRNAKCYRALVDLQLSSNDETSALELWEWYQSAGARVRWSDLPKLVSLANLDQSPVLPGMHEVTNILPSLERETVVVYAELGEWANVWVYDNRGMFWRRIETTPARLDRASAAFASQCSSQGSDLKLLRAAGRSLYDLLIGPIASRLDPNRTLVIEADDGLATIPFAALVDSNGAYLVDNFRLAYLPSIGYRPLLRSIPHITQRDAAVIVSSPTLSVKDQASYPVLPNAQTEAENVASQFDRPTLLGGKQATGLAVSRALLDAAIFHFAGHALSEPGRSGLLLAPDSAAPDAESTLLTTDDIVERPLPHLRLAVLSACSTSLDPNSGVGGAESLARAFLRSGVPDVIATRWSVDSAATEQLMQAFYQRAMETDPPSALQSSMRQVRSLGAYTHPYYWAGFDAFGGIESLRSQ
ncbi:MAG TPA: CHAT domain-containing protein [Terriglobales bacterium]